MNVVTLGNVELPKALSVFALSIGDDILVVFSMRRVQNSDYFWAAVLSGIVTAVISCENWIYVPAPQYIPFNSLGSTVGTPLALVLEKYLPKIRPRDKKGKFKAVPPTPPIPTAEKGNLTIPNDASDRR